MKLLIPLLIGLSNTPIVAAERAVPVKTGVVIKADIQQQVPITGLITSPRVSKVSTRVDGLITELKFVEGGLVKRGDTLVLLDRVLAKIDVERSHAAVLEAQSRLQERQRKRDELQALAKNQYLAKSSYETALAEVRTSKAIVQRLQAAYKKNRQLLQHHVIKAPFDGIIKRKTAEPGEWIKVGDSLLELVEIDVLRVEIDVPQSYFPQLRVNTTAKISIDALPQHPLQGKVSQIIAVADATAHTFPVYINIDNNRRLYAPGMTTRVTLQLQTPQSNGLTSLLVPRDALNFNQNHVGILWLVKEEQQQHRVYPLEVITGRVHKNQVEVHAATLRAGQQVVTRGNETLKSGQRVRLINTP